jgi:hypothetical protein
VKDNRKFFSLLGTLCRGIVRLPARLLIGVVLVYKFFLSPIFGRHCRFTPTCSTYFIESVKKYGALRGSIRGTWRILRCNPWCAGGHDPP